MNKSVLGFIFGLAIIVAGGVGFFLASGTRTTEAPATSANRETGTKAADADNALAAALSAAKNKSAEKKDASPTTPLAEPEKKADEKKDDKPKTAMSKAVSADGMSVSMARSLSTPTYTAGGTVDVALTIASQGSDPVRALGIQEELPEGFSFDSIVDGPKPDIVPAAGATGKIDFAWIQVPTLPATLIYRVKAADGTTGTRTFTGQTLARAGGPELRSEPASADIASADGGAAPAPAPAPASATPESATEAAATTAADAAKMLAENQKKLEETLRAEEAKKAEDQKNAVEVAHTVAAGGYTAGQPLEVTSTLTYAGTTPVSALAMVVTLPAGWTFDKVTGGATPAVAPPAGKTGNSTFIWIQVPTFPATVTYTVNVPAGESGARSFVGKAAYRTDGGQIEGPPGAIEISNK